ncbi:hypothetical protein [Endozoicomonas lisbonensis]|uniref:hypothetical protein n=1 Tax=Endozoicomonas lisbonensis TaxID=3120522 RepID=UPI00339B359A
MKKGKGLNIQSGSGDDQSFTNKDQPNVNCKEVRYYNLKIARGDSCPMEKSPRKRLTLLLTPSPTWRRLSSSLSINDPG